MHAYQRPNWSLPITFLKVSRNVIWKEMGWVDSNLRLEANKVISSSCVIIPSRRKATTSMVNSCAPSSSKIVALPYKRIETWNGEFTAKYFHFIFMLQQQYIILIDWRNINLQWFKETNVCVINHSKKYGTLHEFEWFCLLLISLSH